MSEVCLIKGINLPARCFFLFFCFFLSIQSFKNVTIVQIQREIYVGTIYMKAKKMCV